MTISPDSIESYVEDNMDFGMTHEQIKNFVVNSHVTDKRKLRQVLTEVSTRSHERKKLFLDIERKQTNIDRLEAKLEVAHIALALEPVSVLISQVTPLDEVGLFKNLPVPSSQD